MFQNVVLFFLKKKMTNYFLNGDHFETKKLLLDFLDKMRLDVRYVGKKIDRDRSLKSP